MTDLASGRIVPTADLRRVHLKRLDDAQTGIERAFKAKHHTLLFFTHCIEKSCNKFSECAAPKVSHLRKFIQDSTSFSDETTQHLDRFYGAVEALIPQIQNAVEGFHISGRTVKTRVEECRRNLESTWNLLNSHLSAIDITAGPGAPQAEDSIDRHHLNSHGAFSGPSETPEDGNCGQESTVAPLDEVIESSVRDRPAWRKALDPTRKVLKTVAAAAEPIPGAGPIIKCVVGVLNATIDVLDGLDQNSQATQDLFNRVTQLSTMVAMFQDDKRSYAASSLAQLQKFRRFCESAEKDVERLEAQHLIGNVVFLTGTTNALKDLNMNLGNALEELNMYFTLSADQKLHRLNESDLVSLLGEADKGELRHQVNGALCLPGTREEVLGILESWASDVSPESARLLLLRGQAGRGKSTIARTFAETFRKSVTQATSVTTFHFDRGKDDFNARAVRVLVHQLARSRDIRLQNAVLLAVQDNKDVAESSNLKEQIRTLIVAPLESLKDNPPQVLLVLDALDECTFGTSLLEYIAEYSSSLPPTAKVLVTSRPENHIVRAFDGLEIASQTQDLDAVDQSFVDRDIRAYIGVKLAQIGRANRLGDCWPGIPAVDRLVVLSEKLFQWAYTAVEYIREAPETRLDKLVGPLEPEEPTESEEGLGPVKLVVGLPSLYSRILNDAFPKDSDARDTDIPELLQHVLGSLVVAPIPISMNELGYLWVSSANPTTKLLSRASREIGGEILNRLRSMLLVPASPDEPVHFIHSSVRDFLTDTDPNRDPRFHVNVKQHHARLAETCLKRLKRDLEHFRVENICGPAQTSAEVREAVREKVSPGLVYCARSWSAHLSQVAHDEAQAACLRLLNEFCRTHLIHWMEILGLAEVAHEIIPMTQQSKEWIGHNESYAKTYELLDDGQRLCRQSFQIFATRPYHISRSVLLHCPLETALRHFYSLGSGTPRVRRGPLHNKWPNNLWTKFVGTGVLSVAFSPDGKTIASGSVDKTVRLWNVESGAQIGAPLTGHTDDVNSVMFSLDSKTIVSGSDDKTVRLWNVENGAQIGAPLTGHNHPVLSVVFSRDGKTIASGSSDETIRVWNIESGVQIGTPLTGHSGYVNSVVFSPDGKTIASGSADKTVRLWNVESGVQIGTPLTGHTDAVFSVAFSHDGKTIASGSSDYTIRLWNVENGTQIRIPFTGHIGYVNSIVFSPDGRTIVSGSSDNTLRLWNVESRAQLGAPLTGHSHPVLSVTFSRDGKTIASGSSDETIRVWNVESGVQIGTPLTGHTNYVLSVAFSRDGKTIASGSSDNTVRLWNVENGTQIAQMRSNNVNSLPSFEPDPGAPTAYNKHVELHGSRSGGDMAGWVFLDGIRWFWLPREWYVDPSSSWAQEHLDISLSNNILVIHHPHIHILDVSDIMQ